MAENESLDAPEKVNNIFFGVPSIQDFFIEFLQFCFKTYDLGGNGRWKFNSNVKKTKILIVSPRTYGKEVNDNIPKLIVTRSAYAFTHTTLDQLKSATPGTFEKKSYQDLMLGGITIKGESNNEDEAEYLACLAGMMVHANRKALVKTAKGFIQRIRLMSITQVMPVVIDSKVSKVECAAVIDCPIQTSHETDTIIKTMVEGFNVFGDAGITPDPEIFYENKYGTTVANQDNFVDSTANFGLFSNNNPMLVLSQIDRGQYTLVIDGERYIVTGIINEHTLSVDRAFDATEENIEYTIYHNNTLLKV